MSDADVIREQSGELDAMLEDLRLQHGMDLTSYKRGTLWRRVNRRMQQVNMARLSEYRDYVAEHPEEFRSLLDTILINVTSFFRNGPAWQVLAQEIIPTIVRSKAAHEGIRVWSAGCASGEEAVTLAMLWMEALGQEAYRRRVKIYATDVDEAALAEARAGVYPDKTVDALPADLRTRYFEKCSNQYVCRSDLRRSIVFGRHDLTRDAPICHLDVLVCRNTLIYLTAQTQRRVLAGFRFALNDRGFLFLGKAEMLLSHNSLFHAVDPKSRLFSKTAQTALRDRLVAQARAGGVPTPTRGKAVQLGDRALSMLPIAQVVVDVDGTLALANQRARLMFGLVEEDIGRTLRELGRSPRTHDLCGLIAAAVARRTPAISDQQSGSSSAAVSVTMTPLRDDEGRPLGASFTFADDAIDPLRSKLDHATRKLELAHTEQRAATEHLRSISERLRVTTDEFALKGATLGEAKESRDEVGERLAAAHRELERVADELHGRTQVLNRVVRVLEAVDQTRGRTSRENRS